MLKEVFPEEYQYQMETAEIAASKISHALNQEKSPKAGNIEFLSSALLLFLIDEMQIHPISKELFDEHSESALSTVFQMVETMLYISKAPSRSLPALVTPFNPDNTILTPLLATNENQFTTMFRSWLRYETGSIPDRAIGYFFSSDRYEDKHVSGKIQRIGNDTYRKRDVQRKCDLLQKESWRLCFRLGNSDLFYYISDRYATEENIDWSSRYKKWTDGSGGPVVKLSDKDGNALKLDIVAVTSSEIQSFFDTEMSRLYQNR